MGKSWSSLWGAGIWLVFALSLSAQAVEKTPEQIKAEAALTFTANGVGAITGPNVRDAITNIADSFMPLTTTSGRVVTNKQLRLWASATGTPTLYIYLLTNGIDATPSASEAVFYAGGNMIENDPLALRVQSILGFSAAQMTAAVSAMLLYPR